MVRQVRGRFRQAFVQFLMQQQQRHKCGLPVVQMDDFRLPGQIPREMHDALEKKIKRSALSA